MSSLTKKNPMPRLLANLTPLILGASCGLAQGIGGDHPTLHTIPAPDASFARSLTTGDLNDDGYQDMVALSVNDSGHIVRAYDGVDASLLWERNLSTANISDTSLDTADFDQDGCDDVIYGFGLCCGASGPRVFVLSGPTGEELYHLNNLETNDQYGIDVAALGDIDFDGHPDFLVGSPHTDVGGQSFAGVAYVHSGVDGSIIGTVEPTSRTGTENFGSSVCGLEDQDDDGIDDFAVGMPGFSRGGDRQTGGVCIFSGLDLSPMNCHFLPLGIFQQYGASVASAGDVDGDGKPNLLVGANISGSGNRGAAYILDASFEILYTLVPSGGSFYANRVAGAGDVDEDGVPDFLVNQANPLRTFFYSGADARLIQVFDGVRPSTRPGDVDGDGVPEIVLGSTAGVHAVRWRKFLDLEVTELSATSGAPIFLDLDFPPFEAGHGYALLASLAGTGPITIRGLSIPLTRDKILSRFVHDDAPTIFREPRGFLDAEGNVTLTIRSRPRLAKGLGMTVHLAAVSHTGGRPVRSSLARSFTIVE